MKDTKTDKKPNDATDSGAETLAKLEELFRPLSSEPIHPRLLVVQRLDSLYEALCVAYSILWVLEESDIFALFPELDRHSQRTVAHVLLEELPNFETALAAVVESVEIQFVPRANEELN